MLTIDEYLGLAHSSVEHEDVPAAVKLVSLYVESASVCALAHIRKASGASRLFGRNILTVLDNSYGLQVIGLVKGSVNGPVVRHGNGLPALCCLDVMPLAELPFLQNGLAAPGLGEC